MTARATVSYTVQFGRPASDAEPARPGRVLRVARLLAFAHQIEARVRGGEYADLADAARRLGLTRARVTQLVNLTLLAPEVQEEILEWPMIQKGRDPVTERTLRAIATVGIWERQARLFRHQVIQLQIPVAERRSSSALAPAEQSGECRESRGRGTRPIRDYYHGVRS